MKRMTAITLTAMMVLIASAMAVGAQEVDVRSTVHNLGESTVTWDNSTFAGFYYDINKNIGTESLTFTLTGTDPASKTLSDTADANGNRGVVYLSTAQPANFKFKQWGEYLVIGFLAEKYFAAYDNVVTPTMVANNLTVPFLADTSKNDNLMTNEQISKVLVDDNTERTITSTNPLMLAEGYQLDVKSIDVDGNKVYVELTKNGQVVDDKVIQPSITRAGMSDKTYYLKTKVGDTTDIVQIAVHFKNAFRGADTNIATIDGIFQMSDTPTPLKVDQQYDKMSIREVNPNAMTIKMDNKDNQITLSKNKNTVLMQNIYIQTADQDTITADQPLRFYVFKKYTAPGTYEVRGSVHNLGEDTASWDNSTFAGFYYDINKNIGMETLTFTPTGTDPASKTLSDTQDANGNRGVVYRTLAQAANFKYKPWGQYDVIGFLADKYFAAYENTVTANVMNAGENVAFLADTSKNDNLMTNEQISKVLVDDNTERTITSTNPLMLGEGYQLDVKSIDTKGNKVYVELTKNGQLMDDAVIQPSIDNANMADKTYYYKTKVGDTTDIVQIAVHFKNAFLGADTNIATVDGIFQISDTPTPLKVDQQYDSMSIRNVDPTAKTITMDNKDNQITLSKNKDSLLMTNIHIRTADQDTITADQPLRYYIYKAATIEGAAPVAPAAPANVTAPTNVTPVAPVETVTPPAEVAPAKENVTPAPANATPANATPAAKPAAPGFESIFAITGLMAVAYLVLGRKQ
jgi:S-layer protein (TIGR01567 family)